MTTQRNLWALACLLAPGLATAAPAFVTLDRQANDRRLTYEYRNVQLSGGSAGAVAISGHGLIAPGTLPLGVDGSLVVYGAVHGRSDSEQNLMAGLAQVGLYIVPVDGALIRVGFSKQGEVEDPEDLAPIVTSPAHLSELHISFPESSWLRASGSFWGEQGMLSGRADFGLDFPIDGGRIGPFNGLADDPVMRLQFGAGFSPVPFLTATAELANLVIMADQGDLEDRAIHTFAVGLRGRIGSFEPYAAVVFPLDDGFEDRDFFNLGFQVAL